MTEKKKLLKLSLKLTHELSVAKKEIERLKEEIERLKGQARVEEEEEEEKRFQQGIL